MLSIKPQSLTDFITVKKCNAGLEENKTIIRRLYEDVNTQDLSSLEEIMASDYVDHTRQLRGLEGVKQFGTMLFKAFPDFNETIEDIIAEGDKV